MLKEMTKTTKLRGATGRRSGAESATGVPAPAALAAAVRSVPAPEDYFEGCRAGLPELPDNLLLFSRSGFGGNAEVRTRHHRHVLILNLAGAGTVCLNEKMVPLRPGEALLILPDQLHHYVRPVGAICWLYVTFEAARSDPWLALRDRPVAVGARGWVAAGWLIEDFRAWRSGTAAASRREALALGAALLLNGLLPAPARDSSPAATVAGAAGSGVLERINRVVYGDPGRAWPQAELARRVGVSPSHLRFLVRQSLGVGPGCYVRRIRLSRARHLLETTTRSVREVAAACGFRSAAVFSRAFKRETTHPPAHCRRTLMKP